MYVCELHIQNSKTNISVTERPYLKCTEECGIGRRGKQKGFKKVEGIKC